MVTRVQQVLLIFLAFCTLFSAPVSAARDEVDLPLQSNLAMAGTDSRFLFSASTLPAKHTTQTSSDKVGKAAKPDKSIIRSRTVRLKAGRLRTVSGTTLSDRLVLNLFDDTIVIAIKDRIERNASGSLTWMGHIEGIERSAVLLVVRDNSMVAKIASPGAIYKIEGTSSDLLSISQVDQSEFVDHESKVPEIFGQPGLKRSFEISADAVADDGSVVDVLVAYSPQARSAAGSVAAIESTIELAVAETNMAYTSSNVGQGLKLVYMYESPDAQLAGFSANLSGVTLTADGYMDGVHALRNEYHADFVQLIIEDGTYCGFGYLQATPADNGFEVAAFGVTARTCAAGNFSFGHELGHNMGLRHDWYVDTDITPHSWSHGFTNPPDSWRTVMAYNSHCSDESGYCTRLAYFSNPGNNLGGDPMGVVGGTASNCVEESTSPNPNTCDADNHAVLNSNALTNSQFRRSEIIWLGNSTDWNDANNWSMDEGPYYAITAVSRVPRTIDDVVIPATPGGGSFPTINAGSHSVRNLIIQSGASLNMSTGTLNVHGNWQEQGSGSFLASGGTVTFAGKLDQTIETNNSSNFHHLIIGDGVSTQAVILQGNLDINGDFTLPGGATFSAGSNTIEIAGNWDDQAGGFSSGTSTVILDGSNQTIDRLTTRILLDEPFDEADGQVCCSSAYLPGGWVREHAGGHGYMAGDISGWGGNGGAAVRWHTTADAWLHSPSISMRADASYEIEYKYSTLSSGTTHDFSVSVGTAATSVSMGSALGSVTNAGNTGYLTQVDTFTVANDGVYYLGFRSQQNSGAGDAVIDEIVLREITPMAFQNFEVSDSLSVVINQDLVVHNDLTINSGGVLDLSTNDLTVEGVLNNNGTLKQTKNTPSGIPTEFLRIKNAAGTSDRYFGVVITPSTGSMGSTTVAILADGAIDRVQRSYEITPGTSQTAVTRFYYRIFEQNGQVNPGVFHWNGSSWDDLGASATGGSGDGMFVEATTSDYSPFVLSDDLPTFARIGKVDLSYVSVADVLRNLSRQGNNPSLLLNMLASLNPQLADLLAGAGIDSLLAALASELDPDGDSLVAILEWETLEERGTIGFYVERQTADGQWKRLNNNMLPGMITAPMGAEYMLFDPEVGLLPAYLYRLTELEAWGAKVMHGPWLLEPQH